MQFLKDLLLNIAIYAIVMLVLYLVFPDLISQVYDFLWMMFGPLIFLLLVPAVLPAIRRRRK